MQHSVTGKQINIGSSLQQYVIDHLEKKVKKYFDRPIKADVVFSLEARLFRADIIVNEGTGTGTIIKANGEDNDIYHAFDLCLGKIQKQLRRYKTKIKNHHKRKSSEMDFEENIIKGKKYIISPLSVFNEEHEINESGNDNPVVIAEKAAYIEHLTVSEAVMRMDLEHLPALLFTNVANNRINLVYHRADGNISWVDPENIAS